MKVLGEYYIRKSSTYVYLLTLGFPIVGSHEEVAITRNNGPIPPVLAVQVIMLMPVLSRPDTTY